MSRETKIRIDQLDSEVYLTRLGLAVHTLDERINKLVGQMDEAHKTYKNMKMQKEKLEKQIKRYYNYIKETGNVR